MVLRMSTFQILNDSTKEVVDSAASYIEAIGIADRLTFTTGTLHFVPARVEKTLTYVV